MKSGSHPKPAFAIGSRSRCSTTTKLSTSPLKKALRNADFVAKCQPEPETILADIWELIKSNGALNQDRRTPSYLNFAPSEWSTVPDLNACPDTEWTKTGRNLLF